MHPYQRLKVNRERHHHVLQCAWREREELRHSEQRFRMSTSDFLFSGREHGVHTRHCYAEKSLSVLCPPHLRKSQATEEDQQTESLYSTLCMCASKMGAHRNTECTEPLHAQSVLFRSFH